MQPTIIEISPNADVVKEELFAPVLYVMKFQVPFREAGFSCLIGLAASIYVPSHIGVTAILTSFPNFACRL